MDIGKDFKKFYLKAIDESIKIVNRCKSKEEILKWLEWYKKLAIKEL